MADKPLLKPELRDRLIAAVTSHGLDEILPALEAVALPCFQISTEGLDQYKRVGNSRFGGLPDLPRVWKWPYIDDDGYPTFIAQINLADLPPITELPSKGMLYFFLGSDDRAYDIPGRVLYFSGTEADLARTKAPPDDEMPFADEREFEPYRIAFHAVVSLPDLYLDPAFDDYEDALSELRKTLPGWDGDEVSQLLGHPTIFSGDPREDAYVTASGHSELIHHTQETPEDIDEQVEKAWRDANPDLAEYFLKKRDGAVWFHDDRESHRANVDRWQVLLQIDSHSDVGMVWWDAGLVQFLVDSKALREMDLSKVYSCIQTS